MSSPSPCELRRYLVVCPACGLEHEVGYDSERKIRRGRYSGCCSHECRRALRLGTTVPEPEGLMSAAEIQAWAKRTVDNMSRRELDAIVRGVNTLTDGP